MRDLLWSAPKQARPQFIQKNVVPPDRAALVAEASAEAVQAFEELLPAAQRNQSTIRFAVAACRMYRYACSKLLVLERVAKLYGEAFNSQDPAHAAQSLERAATAIDGIVPQCDALAGSFKEAIDHFGGYRGDLARMEKQKALWQELAKDLRKLSSDLRAGKHPKLPSPVTLGLGHGRYIQAGAWTPSMVREERADLSWRLRDLPKSEQTIVVELEYTRGAHGLRIFRASLVVDGKEAAADEHTGWAGSGSRGNRYKLHVPTLTPNAKVELHVVAASRGGTDSRGNVWLIWE